MMIRGLWVIISTLKIDKVSSPSQPSPSVGGTDGNDRDDISKDEVGGPEKLSSRLNDLNDKLQNHLCDFKPTLEVWLREGDVLDGEVSSMMESQDVKSLDPNSVLKDKLQAMGEDILSMKLSLPALRNLLKAKLSTPGLLKNVADARIGKILKLQEEFNKQMQSDNSGHAAIIWKLGRSTP
ncbi:Mediator of RNA polymerase II transcription subunit 21 [Psidium guajava]|nr:Mediator of RNA polymerase II transcription subunit 21 [Psidium guajava]